MIFSAKVENGKLKVRNKPEFEMWLSAMEGKEVQLEGTKVVNNRTILQNRSLHLLFTQVAEALNESGQDMKQIIKAEIPWSQESVKLHLWKPIQEKVVGKSKTSDLAIDEIDKVYEVFNRFLGGLGIHCPFPSLESAVDNIKVDALSSKE